MELIQQLRLHIQCQKNTAFDIVPQQGGCRNGTVKWPFDQGEVQGTFTLSDLPGGVEGWLSLKLPCRPIDENQHLTMEKPVTLELRLSELPEKVTAMYRYNDWWTRPTFIQDLIKILCKCPQNLVKQRITPHFLTIDHPNYYEFTTKG